MIISGRLILDAASPPEPGWIEVAGDRIVRVESGAPLSKPDLGGPEFLVSPGFVDAHVHLPQVDSIGCDGMPLLEWLDRVIYPAESKWSHAVHARAGAERAYDSMIRAGTLGYAGYLTSHPGGVAETVRVAHQLPLRAIVGQSLMDREAPQELINQNTARLSRSTRGRLYSSLNPRFAVACSDDLLAETGRRLKEGYPFTFKTRAEGEPGSILFLQTHLAETRTEVTRVAELFPSDIHYTAVYDRHGLLGEHTLLAHCVHLSNDEWQLIAERRSVVVHCPTANTFLASGLFDLQSARDHNVRLALGSDVAAGPDVSMPRVARAMIEIAKTRTMTIASGDHVPTPAEAWNLITRGNADALAWSDFGRIEVGASADLLLLRPPFEIDEHLFGRLIYGWRDEWISDRILAGESLSRRSPTEDSV